MLPHDKACGSLPIMLSVAIELATNKHRIRLLFFVYKYNDVIRLGWSFTLS